MTKTYKAISYAFPTSTNAELLGFGETGCWHLEQCLIDIEGSGQCATRVPHNAEGFVDRLDKDLIAMFHELDGVIDPSFERNGDESILEAIKS